MSCSFQCFQSKTTTILFHNTTMSDYITKGQYFVVNKASGTALTWRPEDNVIISSYVIHIGNLSGKGKLNDMQKRKNLSPGASPLNPEYAIQTVENMLKLLRSPGSSLVPFENLFLYRLTGELGGGWM